MKVQKGSSDATKIEKTIFHKNFLKIVRKELISHYFNPNVAILLKIYLIFG